MQVGHELRYAEIMLASLEKNPATYNANAVMKDDGAQTVDQVMRELVVLSLAARNRVIRQRHEKANADGLLAGLQANLLYLTENGLALFASNTDLQSFFALAENHAENTLPEGRCASPLIIQLELWASQKELLARTCARLLWVDVLDLFDTNWKLKFSIDYVEECLRKNAILSTHWPDFSKMERILTNSK